MTPTTTHTKHPTSPLAAGLTGVVIGAAGAAAVALSDKQTREKAAKKAVQLKNDLKKWSTKTIKDLQNRGEDIKTSMHEDVHEVKEDISDELEKSLDEPKKN